MSQTPAAPSALKPFLATIAAGKSLSEAEADRAFDIIMSGEASPAQIGAFLMGLRQRGETVTEIAGAVRAMRAKMTRIEAPAGTIDVCGTGGDGSGSWNISTAVSLVVAGAGVPVAKHGNRAMSSKSGTADALQALGVNLDADMKLIERAIREAGMGFMLAPRHHSAMRHVGPVRVELGMRTIFNLVGPLSNPAGVRRQLVGVFAKEWIQPLAEVLQRLGCEAAWVVHGSDGMDELTTTGPSSVAELKDGKVALREVVPEDAGLRRANAADLKGGDPAANKAALEALLGGAKNAYRDIVLLNAGAALVVAGKAADLKAGAAAAAAAIDSGKAKAVLTKLVAISNAAPGA